MSRAWQFLVSDTGDVWTSNGVFSCDQAVWYVGEIEESEEGQLRASVLDAWMRARPSVEAEEHRLEAEVWPLEREMRDLREECERARDANLSWLAELSYVAELLAMLEEV